MKNPIPKTGFVKTPETVEELSQMFSGNAEAMMAMIMMQNLCHREVEKEIQRFYGLDRYGEGVQPV